MKKFSKKGGKFLIIFSLVILVIGLLAGIILVKQNQDIGEKAAAGCKYNYDRKSCANACSTSKQNGKFYKCKWNIKQDKCGESTKECDSGGQGQKNGGKK